MEDLQKEFVPYDMALRLKALGFDEPCFGFWTKIHGLFIMNTQGKLNEEAGECLAPTFSQAFRWFREKYGWVAEIHGSLQINRFYANLLLQAKGEVNNIKMCDTYEEAELACLKKLIEIVESKSE
jgi:hypothetical protein